MEEPTHVIDPNGEVVFLLPKTVPPFAPCPSEPTTIAKPESDLETTVNDSPNNEGSLVPETNGDDPKSLYYTVQVSAKHLSLASPVLRKCLSGPWKESQSLAKDGYVTLDAGDWDLEAFLLFMNIIHCKTHQLTREISIDRLAQLATIVDYYNCVPAVKFFVDIWIETLARSFPTSHCREVMLWLCIACIFNHQTLFRKATHLAITESNEPLTSLGLPLPTTILSEINRRRTKRISTVFAVLDKEHKAYSDASAGCSFECRSMMLGALTLQRQGSELFSTSASVPPHPGTNYFALVRAVGSFQEPAWSTPPKTDSYGRPTIERNPSQHKCARSTFDRLKENIKGYSYEPEMKIIDYMSHSDVKGPD